MGAKLIHTHGSDEDLNKIYQADVSLCAGPNETCAALSALGEIGDWSEWRNKWREAFLQSRGKARQQGSLNMIEVSAWLDQHLASDAVITNGAGNFAVWPSRFLTYSEGRRLLAPQSGAMGAGVPAAIAAKAVDRNRQVLCFAGDGDFQMSLTELGTAAQEGLQPIILILNNGMYGTIRAHQERNYPDRPSATKIVNPDYVMLARAYGFHAERIERTEDFAAAFQRAEESATGAVLELIIDAQDITPFASLDQIRGVGGKK